jgi:hypothetical protein
MLAFRYRDAEGRGGGGAIATSLGIGGPRFGVVAGFFRWMAEGSAPPDHSTIREDGDRGDSRGERAVVGTAATLGARLKEDCRMSSDPQESLSIFRSLRFIAGPLESNEPRCAFRAE